MTAEDVYQKFNDEFHLEGNNGGIQKHKLFILQMMNEFAKEMCDKQKEICSDFARPTPEKGLVSAFLAIAAKDSIINAPYPPELL